MMTNEKLEKSAQADASASVIGDIVMTHGTLETRDAARSRNIYEDILGLRAVRSTEVSMLTAGRGSTGIACVVVKKTHPQGMENRWTLIADSDEQVRRAQAKAEAAKERGDLLIVTLIEQAGEGISFSLQDFDGNCWEISSNPREYYQNLFEKGDVA